MVWSLSGWLRLAPWVLPRRSYRLRLPAGFDATRSWPLLVLIHGCRQTPDEFAAGTRIAGLADRYGLIVLLPCQTRFANPARCWNWFDPSTVSGQGETALVLAQLAKVSRQYPIDPTRVALAGLSSGAALAAALVVRAGRQFALAALHSGVAAGAASSVTRALEVMKNGPRRTPVVLAAQGLPARCLIIQGSADSIVHPRNARVLCQQLLECAGEPQPAAREPDHKSRGSRGQREWSEQEYLTTRGGRIQVLMVEGLQHAWSGGDPGWPYNDPDGPDVSEMLVQAICEPRRDLQGASPLAS